MKRFARRMALPLAALLGRTILFQFIYGANIWNDPQSRSGAGSRRDSPSVDDALNMLCRAITEYEVSSVSDIPCGDGNWIDLFFAAFPHIDYHGFDIVEDLVAGNRRKFPTRRFTRLDIVDIVPPRADLILCKDLFNHLTYEETVAAIDNMRASGSTYLIATSNFAYSNSELKRFGFLTSRFLDITAPPLGYPPPIWVRNHIGIWRLADMKRG